MPKGKVWPSEWKRYNDRITGVDICQLTDYRGHSHQLYFTESGWYDHGRKLLFCSDRDNRSNLFSLDLLTGELLQLTDLKPDEGDNLAACLHPSEPIAFYRAGDKVVKIHLETLEESLLYRGPEKFVVGNINCSADGKYVITNIREDLSDRFLIDLGNGYVGHRELMEAKPLSRIMRICTEGNGAETVFEDRNFITHINVSPTIPNLITFCHEGPWDLVDQRIWGLNLETGEAWKIRPRIELREKVGHEYWHPDGEHIGYHGFRENGVGFFGKIKYDNTGMEEAEFPFINWHAQSYGFEKVVVDGRAPIQVLIVWERGEGGFSKPKVLCEHRCSFHSQKVHAHPIFSPDGKKLLFTSDKNGYANLYLVDLPENFTLLPEFKA
jgi:oligogalacturonide lyase